VDFLPPGAAAASLPAWPYAELRPWRRAGEDGALWVVETTGPQDLGTYHLYNTATRQLSRLISARPGVEAARLPTKSVVNYKASDGKDLWGYLWLPPGVKDAKNLPLIVVPHGGPEGRDTWGFDPFAIVFASHGYAVLQPNFRGGGGFGQQAQSCQARAQPCR
jgi:dipeptidyl aminopeptidase/acylaminoacyl peptidase